MSGSAARGTMNAKNRISYERTVADRERRKLRARREPDRSIWFGLGAFGIVGWSVAIPTLIGAALGVWLDSRGGGGGISWTLTLIVGGIAVGCLNAWYWIEKGNREIHRRQRRRDGGERNG